MCVLNAENPPMSFSSKEITDSNFVFSLPIDSKFKRFRFFKDVCVQNLTECMSNKIICKHTLCYNVFK